MDALVAWHDCAEGYMWISNIVEGREHAALLIQPFYLLAIEGLRHRMGPVLPGAGAATPEESLMMAKSLVGLGESLATTGQVGEAAGRYVEALRWDSEDREGARPRLAIVLALQGECGSAATALAQAKVDVFSAYAAAVIGFAETEGTGAALDQARDGERPQPRGGRHHRGPPQDEGHAHGQRPLRRGPVRHADARTGGRRDARL